MREYKVLQLEFAEFMACLGRHIRPQAIDLLPDRRFLNVVICRAIEEANY